MLNLPKIAVCLAAFNGKQHIAEQLKSILNQADVEVTIYVSVDLSSDNTTALVESFCNKDARVILLNDGERYGSAAKNFFSLLRDVQFEAFDFVALSDQDDIWQEDKLSHSVQKIQENSVDAYSSNVTAFGPNGKQKLMNKAQTQQQFDYMFESAGPGCTFVLTKRFALELQQFLIANQGKCQQVALHDWFIYAFARSKGFKWFIDSESHMLYRQHADNVVGANVGLKAKLVRWGKLREGWLIKQALLIADILGYTDAWPISKLKRYSLLDRLVLIVNVRKLRRRLRDRVALALFLLLPLRK
jgi:rhamnosyltransferase